METRLSKDPSYQRLNKGRAIMGNVSYWLAVDHLLLVQVTLAQEQYRRFELRDLELMVVRPNSVRRIAGWVVGILLAIFLGLAGFATFRTVTNPAADEAALAILAAIPAAILGIVWLWILVPGRFCQVRIRTGVQTLFAPGIVRLPKARRFVAAIRAAVEAMPAPLDAHSVAVPAVEPGATEPAPPAP